jgi:hypothetical protein
MMKILKLWNSKPEIPTENSRECETTKKGKCTMKPTRPLRFTHTGTKRIRTGIVFAIAIMFMHHPAAADTNKVDLGSASSFAVLGGSGITVAGPVNSTVITGDIGTFPTTTITGLGNVVLNGTNHAGDGVTQTAKGDLTLSYMDAARRTPTTYYGAAYDLVGLTLTSGVYNGTGSFAITGALTLDAGGDPNAVWIFQMVSTLTTASGSQIILTNGAQAANVFWQCGSSATLGTDSYFAGTILALDSITLTTGATVDGRVLARNALVTLDNNTINAVPEPGSTLLIGLGAAMVFVIRREFPGLKSAGKDASQA